MIRLILWYIERNGKRYKKASVGVENELTREFTETICADNVRKCV